MTALDRYDVSTIEKMADRLLTRADRLIIFYTLVGILVGLVFALLAIQAFPNSKIFAAPAFGVAVVIGYSIGNGRAFSFRLQAQLLLCQARIEDNTATLVRQHQALASAVRPAS
ncbi:MAG: hypothetical protein Tsb0020_10590 [Haliangiales bacterium]